MFESDLTELNPNLLTLGLVIISKCLKVSEEEPDKILSSGDGFAF